MLPKNPPLIVGLAAPGLLWLATSVARGQDTPPAPPGPPTQAPSPQASGPKAFRALLLSNGKVITGEIVEDTAANLYQLRQGGGVVGYPQFKVLAAGQSVDDLYRFQANRLPEGDPDERMKLARWCLTEHLTAQAKEQLEAIRAMCPDDADARRMLYNLATAEQAGPSKVDDGFRRTSGEVPATLDPRVITKAQRRFNALPEIFDLPQAQAVKRANEFAEHVQPVLLQSCAKCHNEKYAGEFQLVEVKVRRDQSNPDIARANLDATLRLVNPDDPARSPLLSAGLVPHGGSKSAIFRGPNDRSYQVLAQWTRSLRPAGPSATAAAGRGFGDGVSRTGYAPPSADDPRGGGFASERPGRPSAYPSTLPDPANQAPTPYTPPGQRIVDRYEESASFVNAPGDNPRFDVPYVVGGPPPANPGPRPAAKARAGAKPTATASPATPSNAPAVSKKTAAPAGTGAVVFEATADPNELPGMDLERYPPKASKDGDDADEADAPKKKPKPIDGAKLEKLLRSRNGGTP